MALISLLSQLERSLDWNATDFNVTWSQNICKGDPYSIHEKIKRVVLGPVSALILVTNLMILVYLRQSRRAERPSAGFLVSLCLADLMSGLTSLTSIFTNSEEPVKKLCLLRIGLLICATIASIIFLLLIALDRYLAVTRSLNYEKIVTVERTFLVITTAWIFAFGLGLAPLCGWNSRTYKKYCSFQYVLDSSYILFLLASAIFPIFIVAVVNLFLYRQAKLHIRKIDVLSSLHTQVSGGSKYKVHGWSARDWKCFRQLVVVLGCLLATWSPFLISSLVDISDVTTPCWLKDVIGTHFLVMGVFNSALNPLIYTVRTRDFREFANTQVMSKKSCCKRRKRHFTSVERIATIL